MPYAYIPGRTPYKGSEAFLRERPWIEQWFSLRQYNQKKEVRYDEGFLEFILEELDLDKPTTILNPTRNAKRYLDVANEVESLDISARVRKRMKEIEKLWDEYVKTQNFTWEDLDTKEILEHYLIAALWSSLDDNDEPLDDNYSVDDIAESAKEEQLEEICDWLSYCDELELLEKFLEQPQVAESTRHSAEAMLGHDFWLTRNGHGAGFWDRGLGELGEQLSDACKTFGSCDPYVGDDELIYFT